jgi:hypothetical protein
MPGGQSTSCKSTNNDKPKPVNTVQQKWTSKKTKISPMHQKQLNELIQKCLMIQTIVGIHLILHTSSIVIDRYSNFGNTYLSKEFARV